MWQIFMFEGRRDKQMISRIVDCGICIGSQKAYNTQTVLNFSLLLAGNKDVLVGKLAVLFCEKSGVREYSHP